MELSYKPTRITLNQREIKNLIHNKRRIARVIYNGKIIWSSSGTPFYVELEKENVDLDKFNEYQDTNELLTNTFYKIQ